MKKLMITKNPVVKIKNLIMNHKSQPIKLNPVYFHTASVWMDDPTHWPALCIRSYQDSRHL